MTVPSFHHFIDPLLRLLARRPDGITAGKAADLLADEMQLGEQDRAALLPVSTSWSTGIESAGRMTG